MDDIFFFQKIYSGSDNFDILTFKKILEIKKKQEFNIKTIQDQFRLIIKKYIDKDDYSINIKNNLYKSKLFYFQNIYNHLLHHDFSICNDDFVNYEFIKKMYKINQTNIIILKLVYDNVILITNIKDFNDYFKNINLDKFSYDDLYLKLYNKIDNNFLKNIKHLEIIFENIKKELVFKFYKVLFRFKNYNDNDLVYFLLMNDYKIKINEFIKEYQDIYSYHAIKKKNNFIINYLKNYNNINYLLSKKLFKKIFSNFDINFFTNIYDELLINNNINLNSDIDIYNFFLNNNDLLTNIDEFDLKFNNIDINLIKYLYLENDCDKFNMIKYIIFNKDITCNIKNIHKLINKYNFNLILFNNKFNNNYELIKFMNENKNILTLEVYNINLDYDFIYNYYKFKNLTKKDIQFLFNFKKKYIRNANDYLIKNNINLDNIKILNNKCKNLQDNEIIDYMTDNNLEKKIINFTEFKNNYVFNINKNKKFFLNDYSYLDFIKTVKNINNEDEFIKFITKDIYNININKNSLGRKNVFMIEEVLLDLELKKPELKNGVSLIIRAKNEQENIKLCIESVVDLVDEIIFVNNNSTDKTLEIINDLGLKYDKIKIYNYFINVNRVGVEHQNALKNKDNNTLANFYNWCLYKSTMKNVIKWDADFICIKNNFQSMINNYKIIEKKNQYALWFSGFTLFINDEKYYINLDSYYNEFRLFSYYSNFKWYDGDLCEFNEPYIEMCSEKIRVNYPIFYEIKRTNSNEFSSRSSLIDNRDITDFNILKNLMEKEDNEQINLYKLDKDIINSKKKIGIINNYFNIGGSNVFMNEIYKYFKIFGFDVKIYCEKINKNVLKNNNLIDKYDVININNIDYNKIFNNLDYLLFNGYIPNNIIENKFNIQACKILITHSDVAYSNYYIQEYHQYLDKIITVNNYTKMKIERFNDIDPNKIYKTINYVDINCDIKKNQTNNKIFGIICRFSDDKNIIMLLFSLKRFFNIYNDYKFYLVGYEDESTQRYIIHMIKYLKIDKFIEIKGYQNNTKKFYELFDFIVLPSVSEGTSYNLIESMIFKKLIVVSDVGGNKELLNDNCIFIDYQNIKEFEYDNFYIKNYHSQLNLLGYFIIDDHNEFLKEYKCTLDYNIDNLKILPSILVEKRQNYSNKKCNLNKLIENWDLNVYNIFNALIKAVKMDNKKKDEIISNNYNKILNQHNKLNYYNNLDKIFNI